MKPTTCQKALQVWQEQHPGENPQEAEVVKLFFQMPPIEKMEAASLNTLVACKQLSLSSNCIDKMINLPALRNLEILSLSRNNIKKISGLDEIGLTLKQLWLSYNLIERLDGLQTCVKLEVLFISNNKIKNWDEVDKLKELPSLANVLLVNNPIYEGYKKDEASLKTLQKLRNLKQLDGMIVTETMLEAVRKMDEEAKIESPTK